jgi:hypothetical protein
MNISVHISERCEGKQMRHDTIFEGSRVRSPALPDFLSSSGSGTGSTQPREVNRGAT